MNNIIYIILEPIGSAYQQIVIIIRSADMDSSDASAMAGNFAYFS